MNANDSMAPAMALALRANFGSVQRWRDEVEAIGKAHAGAGWLLLVFQPHEGTLVNQWAAQPSPAILAIDLAGGSIDGIDWPRAYERYQQAVEHASDAFGADQQAVQSALLLDVRRDAAYAQSGDVIPGAQWRDPGEVGHWAASLPADREVVVYCVYGHEVGRTTAMRLRAAGINARYLRGGIDGWKAAGKPLESKSSK